MSKPKKRELRVVVGGGRRRLERQAADAFVQAWHRAEQGETFVERSVAFESWDSLARVLTPKRLELLRYIRRHPSRSIRSVGAALNRDYSNIHADLRMLAHAGLVEMSPGDIRADYDTILTRIAL